MKLSDGIEQAIHSVAMLSGLSEGSVISAAALAEYHGISTSYLLKHLQALSGVGILQTLPGPKGGYRLARMPQDISLLDIVLAIEGPEPAFRCKEIRQRGPKPPSANVLAKPCGISIAMLQAEQCYRAELERVTIADIMAQVTEVDDGSINERSCQFLSIHERKLKTNT